MATELKPCPFCGGVAKIKEERDPNWNNESRFTIICQNSDCGAKKVEWINQYDPNWNERVKSFCEGWNRRVEDTPKVDAVEVVHGRWEREQDGAMFFCSNCRLVKVARERLEFLLSTKRWNYCPNCGADMRERKDND